MTPDEFADRVERENRTALSRLGSSKSLYAATEGEMDPGAVLAAAADAESQAERTFRAWAESEGDEAAAAAWADTAEEEADHYDQVREHLGDHDPSGDPAAMHAHLRDLDDTVERAGAFLGRVLASDASKEQMTGFFVGQADPQTAELFRDLRGDLDAQRERALELLEAVCGTDGDWERAATAADATIQTAYEEYTETLEGMGVNPKPVC